MHGGDPASAPQPEVGELPAFLTAGTSRPRPNRPPRDRESRAAARLFRWAQSPLIAKASVRGSG